MLYNLICLQPSNPSIARFVYTYSDVLQENLMATMVLEIRLCWVLDFSPQEEGDDVAQQQNFLG